jgi:formamidopyrimidine-DNA glycosylase
LRRSAAFLTKSAVGRAVARVDVASIHVLKTYDPPVSALAGLEITGVTRHGKFLDLDVSGLHLVVHLARAGWLHWKASLPPVPPRPGKGPLALRVHLDDGSGFDLTEAGTQKKLAAYVVRDPLEVPGVARLGPDPLDDAFTPEVLAGIVGGSRQQIKGLLRDQSVVAGIGNAYSDEVLHVARMSPFKLASSLTPEDVTTLHAAIRTTLLDAVERSRGLAAGDLKAEKKTGCGCTRGPASRARCAATPCGRCRSRTPRCSTARPARPAASRWPTVGCPVCCASRMRRRPEGQRRRGWAAKKSHRMSVATIGASGFASSPLRAPGHTCPMPLTT